MVTRIRGEQIQDGSIEGKDILDGSIGIDKIDITTPGKSLVTRIAPGDGIEISSTGVDSGTGEVTISATPSEGITQITHQTLDQLVHNLSENYYYEVVKDSVYQWRVNKEIWWTDNTKTKKIRENIYNYNSTLIWRFDNIISMQYNGNGVVVETQTDTYDYSGIFLNSITSQVIR